MFYCKGIIIIFLFVLEMVFKVNVYKVFVIILLFINVFDSLIIKMLVVLSDEVIRVLIFVEFW